MTPLTLNQVRRILAKLGTEGARHKAVSLPELIDVLADVSPSDEVYLVARTEAREIEKGNPFGPLEAVKRRLIQLNVGYADAVNARRRRERKRADFEAKPRNWGESIGLPFVEHDGKLYLSCHVLKNLDSVYYNLANRAVPRESLAGYFKPARTGSRQGIREAVQYRNYDVTNILAVQIDDGTGLRGYVPDA